MPKLSRKKKQRLWAAVLRAKKREKREAKRLSLLHTATGLADAAASLPADATAPPADPTPILFTALTSHKTPLPPSPSLSDASVPPASPSTFDAPLPPADSPTSAKKRNLISVGEERVTQDRLLLVWESNIEEILKGQVCNNCLASELEVVYVKKYLDTLITVRCRVCSQNAAEEYTPRDFHPITSIVIYVMMLLGLGYKGFEKLCGCLSLGTMQLGSYVKYAQRVTDLAVEKAQSVLACRETLVKCYKDKLGREPDEDDILNIDVSLDGSWHARGHKSTLGVWAAVDVNSGLVVDYEVLSNYCARCNVLSRNFQGKKISKEQYRQLLAEHSSSLECESNYKGDCAGMEEEAALRLWRRSLGKGLRYVNLVSDGHSSVFVKLKSMNNGRGPYGSEHEVKKEECVNYVARRFDTALRKLKDEHTTDVMSGNKRLTDDIIEQLVFYIGASVRRNVTSVTEMRSDIMSSFFHFSSTDEKPQHHLCPLGENSWCFYQEALAKDETPKPHTEMAIKLLDKEVRRRVYSIYERLTSDDLLLACLAITHNSSDSLQARIWKHCPKDKNVSKRMLDFAAATAVSNYNAGHAASHLDAALGFSRTHLSSHYLRAQDAMMDAPAKRKQTEDSDYTAGGFKVVGAECQL